MLYLISEPLITMTHSECSDSIPNTVHFFGLVHPLFLHLFIWAIINAEAIFSKGVKPNVHFADSTVKDLWFGQVSDQLQLGCACSFGYKFGFALPEYEKMQFKVFEC